jgi:hypothetical protein
MLTQKEIEEIENLVEPLQIYIIEKMKDQNIKIVIDAGTIEVLKTIGSLEK